VIAGTVATLELGGRHLAAGSPCFVIAEAGTAHAGDLRQAQRLIRAVVAAGADCVKFQYVIASELVHPDAGAIPLPGGQTRLFDRFRELERPVSFYRELKQMVEAEGAVFLCSAFGVESARQLHSLNVDGFKLASPETNHVPLLQELARFGLPVLASTGVTRPTDIAAALGILRPATRVALLHCITEYPAPADQYNLRLMARLQNRYHVPVGVSDHSLDPVLVPSIAAALGAAVLEKHVTLRRDGGGLDDPIALEPPELARMVAEVRLVEEDRRAGGEHAALARIDSRVGKTTVAAVLGNGAHELAPAEHHNYFTTNRSLLFVAGGSPGDLIDASLIAPLRSEKNMRPGLSALLWDEIVGRRLARAVHSGDPVGWGDISGGEPDGHAAAAAGIGAG
jgi:sialic acid synthase SpsE